MNMFARFDENPAMPLQDIKDTKRDGRTHGRTHAWTDNVKTVYPPQTKIAGGIIITDCQNNLSQFMIFWRLLHKQAVKGQTSMWFARAFIKYVLR